LTEITMPLSVAVPVLVRVRVCGGLWVPAACAPKVRVGGLIDADGAPTVIVALPAIPAGPSKGTAVMVA